MIELFADMASATTHLVGALPMDIEIPDVQPDFDSPFNKPLQLILSWVLAFALGVALLALIAALLILAFRKAMPEAAVSKAGDSIVTIFIVAAILGGVSTIFQFFVNFDLGF